MGDQKKIIEEFFITMLESKCGKSTSYLEMPTNNSFKFCLREIIYCLQKNNEDKLIRDYTISIYTNFYKYMQKDIIFKHVNDFEYRNLLLKLKQYSENSSQESSKQKLSYFQRLNRRFAKDYKYQCYKMFVNIYNSNDEINLERLYEISDIFINELLAYHINYKFIGYVLEMYKQENFKNFLDFIKYLHYANKDNMEIYIPIHKQTDKDIRFLISNGQEILEKENEFYCKLYGNKMIDFYSWINRQNMRIESIFNTLRFYTNSEIEFNFDKNVLVNSSVFNRELEVPFKEIVSYTNKTLKLSNMKKLTLSLSRLKGELETEDDDDDGVFDKKNKKRIFLETSERKELYYKILNILSFVEKDKDLLNHNSFVDNWTALETLCGLSRIRQGYDSVRYYVPKIITTKIILHDINEFLIKIGLRKSDKNRAVKFIEECRNKTYNFDLINNSYYKFMLQRYSKTLSNLNTLESYIKKVENLLEYDIMRIYIIRNEYAHESNLNISNSMQQFKLKTLLPLILDEFFRIMNTLIEYNDGEEGLAFEVFNNLFLRYQMRNNTFELINKGLKIQNGGKDLKINISESDVTENEFIFNVLKNNGDLLKKYKETEEYK